MPGIVQLAPEPFWHTWRLKLKHNVSGLVYQKNLQDGSKCHLLSCLIRFMIILTIQSGFQTRSCSPWLLWSGWLAEIWALATLPLLASAACQLQSILRGPHNYCHRHCPPHHQSYSYSPQYYNSSFCSSRILSLPPKFSFWLPNSIFCLLFSAYQIIFTAYKFFFCLPNSLCAAFKLNFPLLRS